VSSSGRIVAGSSAGSSAGFIPERPASTNAANNTQMKDTAQICLIKRKIGMGRGVDKERNWHF
jgi:hypothetical protein